MVRVLDLIVDRGADEGLVPFRAADRPRDEDAIPLGGSGKRITALRSLLAALAVMEIDALHRATGYYFKML